MKRLLAVTLGLVVTTLALPAVSEAADPCPVTEAKAALTSAQASLKSRKVEAPRGRQEVREAEAACHEGHMVLSATKAKEALAHLKK